MSDFFEADKVYTENEPFRAPELRRFYKPVWVGPSPADGKLLAFGFGKDGAFGPWELMALLEEHWLQGEGWIETDELRALDERSDQ